METNDISHGDILKILLSIIGALIIFIVGLVRFAILLVLKTIIKRKDTIL